MVRTIMGASIAAGLVLVAFAGAGAGRLQPGSASEGDPAYVLGHKAVLIDGTEQDLSAYRGKVVLVVNVASKCGFTSQYEGLQKLYEEHKDRGFVVLGFPANDFKEQEPGSNEEIAEFCKANYGVTFPVFEKVRVVRGHDQHPLYKQLTSLPEPIGGDPKWNFTKFLVDREGRVVARFDADKKYVRTPELEPALVAKVGDLINSK